MISTLILLLGPFLLGYLLGSIPFGLLLTRAAALQRASERQRDSGLAWRLPTGGLLVFSAISDGTQS